MCSPEVNSTGTSITRLGLQKMADPENLGEANLLRGPLLSPPLPALVERRFVKAREVVGRL
jgi:hypothetical protein